MSHQIKKYSGTHLNRKIIINMNIYWSKMVHSPIIVLAIWEITILLSIWNEAGIPPYWKLNVHFLVLNLDSYNQ